MGDISRCRGKAQVKMAKGGSVKARPKVKKMAVGGSVQLPVGRPAGPRSMPLGPPNVRTGPGLGPMPTLNVPMAGPATGPAAGPPPSLLGTGKAGPGMQKRFRKGGKVGC